jgi:hypothetical protein
MFYIRLEGYSIYLGIQGIKREWKIVIIIYCILPTLNSVGAGSISRGKQLLW